MPSMVDGFSASLLGTFHACSLTTGDCVVRVIKLVQEIGCN